MALVQVLKEKFTNPVGLPQLILIDEAITDNSGCLFLLDFNHKYNTDKLNNLAVPEGYGSKVQVDDIEPTWYNKSLLSSAIMTFSANNRAYDETYKLKALVSKSSKNSLVFQVYKGGTENFSDLGTLLGKQGFCFSVPGLAEYIKNNPNNEIVVTALVNIKTVNDVGVGLGIVNTSNFNATWATHVCLRITKDTNKIGKNIYVSDSTGKSSSVSNFHIDIGAMLNSNGGFLFKNSTTPQKIDIALSRIRVDDITVSGKTRSEIQTQETEIMNKLYAEGGRKYEETWSDYDTAFSDVINS